MFKYTLLLFAFFLTSFLTAQKEAGRTCGVEAHMEQLLADPVYAKMHQDKIKRFEAFSKERGVERVVCSNPVQLPMAIHFQDLSNPDLACLTDLALDQVQILNDDIQGLNSDITNWTNNASNSFPGINNGETCVEFCIANQNHPSGYGLNNGELAITVNQISGKFSSDWSGYLNIFVWVVNNDPTILGESPLGGIGNGDGVSIAPFAFGSGSGCSGVTPGPPYDLGRTLSHELGHYLLLPHPWGFGNGGCGTDDGITDTPVTSGPHSGCPAIGVSTCMSPDLHMNYMDYVNDACMYMFTEEQATVMENYVSSNLNNLTSNASNVCGAGGPDPINTFLIDWKDPSCFGFADGFIIAEADGGVGNFFYTLNGTTTNTTGEFLNLPAGNYTIEIEDGDGNLGDPLSISLFDPDPLSIVIDVQENITCFGYDNGEIEVDAFGGAGNYLFSINGGSFTSSGLFTGLPADSYVIIVSDDNGCESVSNQIVLEEPNPFTIELDSLLAPECGANNGILIAEAIGGESLMGQYTYYLDSLTFDTLMIDGMLVDTIYHDTIAIISSDTLGVFENLYAGIYNISVVDVNGCFTVLDLLELSAADAIQINIMDSYLNLDCGEDENGFVGIEGSNTVGPYTYSSDGVNFSALGLFNNLSANNYQFYVMDGAGCVNSVEVEVTAPEILEFTLEETQTLLCHNGNDAQITLNASGGTGNYTFYQDGDNNPIPNVVNNLSTGIWTFSVFDENNCTTELQYFIEEPDAINILIEDLLEVECFGDETGEAQIAAEGGVGNINFTIGTITNTTGFFTGLTSGSYTVLVTDGNECTSEELFEIEQTSDLQLSIDIIDEVACTGDANGSFSLKAEGGTGDYMYSLDGVNFTSQEEYFDYSAGLYDVFVSDGNDCITIGVVEMDDPELLELEINQLEFLKCNGDGDAVIRLDATGGTGDYVFSNGINSNSDGFFTNQGAGTFSFSVSDENECVESVSYTIEEPELVVLEITDFVDNSCDGKMVGSITASGIGGTGNLLYTVTGQGANGNGFFDNLPAGQYTVRVRDVNGCDASQEVTIENTIAINLSLVQEENPSCFAGTNGSLQVSVSGSGGGEEFTIGSTTNTTGLFTDLGADTYLVQVVDNAGCKASLEVILEEPIELSLMSIDIFDVSCNNLNDGSVVLTAVGGTGNITFTMEGESNSTGIFSGLEAGEYTYQLMDENGCVANLQTNQFTVLQPDEITINTSIIIPIDCFGEENGVISVSANGGNGSISVNIPGVGTSEGIFEEMSAGSYTIIATDINGCSTSSDYDIEQPSEVVSSVIELIDVDCNGASSGAVSFNTVGGEPGYTYTMEGISSAVPGYINLSAGNYSTIVSDNNGCAQELQFVISEPDAFTIEATSSSDNGETNGTIRLNIIGGLAPYTINSTGSAVFDASNLAENLSTGIYTIEVTDANNCLQFIEVEVMFDDKLDNVLDGTTMEHVLYPVPSNTILNLTLRSPNDQDLYFYILDATGKFIYERNEIAVRGENAYAFSIDDFSGGNYVLGLISERQNLHFKFQVID